MIQLSSAGKHFGSKTLFEGLNWVVGNGERVGLVGGNGTGKSTLLKMLAGMEGPDDGDISFVKGTTTGYLPQDGLTLSGRSVQEECLSVFSHLLDIEKEMETLTHKMAELDPNGPEYQKVADRYHKIETRFQHQDGYRLEAQVGEVLNGLGFSRADQDRRTEEFSGGWQMRIALAKLLLTRPNMLLLDEPTNHLDLATLHVFEAFLAGYRGGFVLVSHDRAFLDAVTDRTWFLRDGRLACFDLPFSAARQAQAEQDDAARRARHAEERRIEALRASAKRLATWGRVYDNEKFAKRARSMEKRVERLEGQRTFVTAGSPLELSLDLAGVRSKEVLRVESLVVAPADAPEHHLFEVEQLLVRPGERIALLGSNGVGKSTFIRLVVATARGASIDGIRISPQAQLGYYDQELDETAGDETLADFVAARVDANDATVRRRLINAGFPYRDHGKRLLQMSGGERARSLFVVLSLQAPSFLILDEPTNHIDIDGKEELERQLLESGAAVLITSHDRRFLDTVAERFVWIRNGRLIEIGDPAEYYAAPEVEAMPPRVTRGTPFDVTDPLTRIVELEALLEADRARKQKFQKPALQRQWQDELNRLYRALDAS
jgi:ATP-binding cassette, subfamily F, member 3